MFYTSGVVVWDFFHQEYVYIQNINKLQLLQPINGWEYLLGSVWHGIWELDPKQGMILKGRSRFHRNPHYHVQRTTQHNAWTVSLTMRAKAIKQTNKQTINQSNKQTHRMYKHIQVFHPKRMTPPKHHQFLCHFGATFNLPKGNPFRPTCVTVGVVEVDEPPDEPLMRTQVQGLWYSFGCRPGGGGMVGMVGSWSSNE